jgi:hypothetical protein
VSAPVIAFLLMCFASPTNPVIAADYLLRNETACENIRRSYAQIYPEKNCMCLPVVTTNDYAVVTGNSAEPPQE